MSATAADRTGASAPFSLLAVAAMLVVGIAAFCAFLFVAAYAPDWADDERGGANALSQSAIGFAGLVGLLKAMDVPVAVNRIDPIPAGLGLLVLTPPAGGGAPRPWPLPARAQATLVVLPKWNVEPLTGHPGWVEREGLLESEKITSGSPKPIPVIRRSGRHEPILHGGGEPFSGSSALAPGPISDLQVIDTEEAVRDWTPILLDETGGTVLARLTRPGMRPVYVLSDPDLLDTQGLKTIAGARAAIAIVERLRGGASVVFDLTLNGFGRSPNLLRLMFEPPLLGATICAAGAALLILAMAVRRFGPALPPVRVLDFGKRALADNAAGLIAIAGRERRMALPYAELIRTRALHDIGAPHGLTRSAADRLLEAAARARGLPAPYSALAGEAAQVANRAALVAVAGRLFHWGKDIRRGYR